MEGYREINASFSRNRQLFRDRAGHEFEFTSWSGPYEYLLGALAGCWIYTLFGALKETTEVRNVQVAVRGKKRDTVPQTLEDTVLSVTAEGCSDREDFLRAAEDAKRDCSIYRTIAGVSRMEVSVTFAD